MPQNGSSNSSSRPEEQLSPEKPPSQLRMPSSVNSQTDRYIENRAAFAVETLAEHVGKWIAFSPDGTRILDSDESLAKLRKRLTNVLHAELNGVVFERVATEAMILSGAELP